MTRLAEALPTLSYADKTLPGVCPQKEILAADYRAQVRSFVAAVEEWEHIQDSVGTERGRKSFGQTVATRLSCENARVALRTHVRVHGCS